MKAIRVHQFGGPEVLKFEEVSDPTPGAGQLVIAAKAIGVNPVDTYIRAGNYGPRPFPYIPGMDAAGVVERVGEGVKRFKVGDRVYLYGTGTYAEKILATESQAFPLPDSLSFQQGASIGVPYATAYYALITRGQAKANEWLLIHGASGGVGVAALQLAKAQGLRIIGTASTPKGQELVKKEGARQVLDHRASDFAEQLTAATEKHGVDLILEMLANVNLGNDLKYLAPRGRVVVIGSRGKVEIDPRDTMSRNADIRGMSLVYASADEVHAVHRGLAPGLKDGTLKPVIGEEFRLAEAAKAHESVMENGSYGKIVLIP